MGKSKLYVVRSIAFLLTFLDFCSNCQHVTMILISQQLVNNHWVMLIFRGFLVKFGLLDKRTPARNRTVTNGTGIRYSIL